MCVKGKTLHPKHLLTILPSTHLKSTGSHKSKPSVFQIKVNNTKKQKRGEWGTLSHCLALIAVSQN